MVFFETSLPKDTTLKQRSPFYDTFEIMALPNFLIIEMRLAFKNCTQQYNRSSLRCFSSTAIRKDDPPSNRPSNDPYNRAVSPKKPSNTTEGGREHGGQAQDRTGLVTQDSEKKAVGASRRVPVPLKVIPKAQLGPNVHLSPRQRLHVEMLTRRPNISVEEKKNFRERIQIYHMGSFKENILAILKVSSIVCACAVTFVIAPAHLNAGTPLWIIALIWLGGFVPGFMTNYMTKSWVNRIFLDLPEKARHSPKAVMEYAKNLPGDAKIDIRYLKLWGLEGSVKGSTSEFTPTKGNFLRPLTFTWSAESPQKRTTSRFVPNSFFVQSKTATGTASTNTVPGIWETVYKQIIKEPGKDSPKWKSYLGPYET